MKKYFVYIIVLLCGILVFCLQFDYGKKYQPYTFYQVYLDDERIGVIKSKEEFEDHIASQGEVIKEQVSNYTLDTNCIKSVKSIMKKVILSNNTYYADYQLILKLQTIYDQINKLVDDKGKITGDYNTLVNLYNSLNIQFTNGTTINQEKIENYEILKNNIDNFILSKEKNIVNYLYNNKDKLNLTSSEYSQLEEYVNNDLVSTTYSRYVYMNEFVDTNEIYLYTDDIYEPLGINVKKIVTYNNEYKSVEEIYNTIIDKKPCTIEGYQFKIKKPNSIELDFKTLIGAVGHTDYDLVGNNATAEIIIYVTDPSVFNDAIEEMTKVFVGSDEYEAYKENKQKEIISTGSRIENIYLKEDITIKETNISIKEKIYNDSSSLASYLIYGDKIETSTIYATADTSISELAYKNGISIEEFFLSNPSFTSIDNMFYDGQPITITKLSPQLSLVIEEYQVVDKSIDYEVIEEYDDTMIKGDEKIKQKGSKGSMRVYQTVQRVNGSINFIDMESNETLKNATNEIVLVGTKEIPNVGSLASWGWPTKSGYTLTSYFGWRAYPFNPSRREFHAGLDIAGTGYGSPIYASNNGTIVSIKSESWNYGNSIIINHNNGYWTNYGHMSGFAKGLKVGDTVARGQVIGYMGKSGAATGTHLHFEIRKGQNRYSAVVDPLPYLRK